MVEKNKRQANEQVYLVLRTDKGFFEDVWEDWSDDENFSFTDNIENAYRFLGGLAPSWGNAPKYLFDNTGKTINNLKEAREYFGGEIIEVRYTRVVNEKYEWNVIKC